MKKLSIFAAAAAIAAAAAAPVAAQENTQDPFVSTAGPAMLPLVIIGGFATVFAIAAASGTK
ncbi:hypothetical protein [Antarctobacter jejuensis]|uniref:hypothetical protein n=1 Tax=Antarctobacter jejuensis TaxID=1439938 RepID=UPI003FCFB836